MTKTVEDMAIVMQVIAGKDELDATTVPEEVPNFNSQMQKDLTGLRVGVPKEYFELDGLDKEVREATQAQIDSLEKQGATIINVSLPLTKYAMPVYYVLVPSEDSSNMGRLDGVRYGVRADAKNLFDVYAKSRENGFPEEVKRRILIGTYALSSGYYDAYYKKAQQVRTLIRLEFDRVFSEVDVLVTPSSPYPAFGVGEKSEDTIAMYLADVFMAPASCAGLPGVSVPSGKTKNGLPIGVQIIGPRFSEGLVMNVANKIFKQ
ncbi:MAG: aspartyl/glutamyl-tRNA(Asn/Gln) amidotransferase subunit A, partial [uncultured bacterium]